MTKLFHLQPWTPRIDEVANSLISNIHAALPGVEVLFMGAAALGLPGKNDIDLDILCDANDITTYTDCLVPILGQPKDQTAHMTVWECIRDGFEIDAILSDPRESHVPEQRQVFERLKTDLALRTEYEQLKQSCDGLPYTDYEERKKEFFRNKVLI